MRCRALTAEPCPVGPVGRRPGDCLDCGAPIGSDGVCRRCGIEQAALVARVHAHCGAPPQLDAIRQVAGQGLVRVAFNALELRLTERPEDLDTLLAKARLLLDVCEEDRAELVVRRMLELGGADDELALELVDTLRKLKPLEALRICEDLLVHAPDRARQALALSGMGDCLMCLGRHAEAECCFLRAFATDPKCLRARWKLAGWLTELEEYGRALEVLRQIEALPWLEPDTLAELHARQANLLSLLSEHSEALSMIDRSLTHDPTNEEWLALRAEILLDLERFAAARACIGTLANLAPDAERVWILLRCLEVMDPCVANN